MDQWYPLIRGTLATAWRRRWLLVATLWAVCLFGWAGVALIPNSYEARARVYVDTDVILTPLLKGLAVNTTPTSELEIVQKTLLSVPNLDAVIDATPLHLAATSSARRQQMIMKLEANIRVSSQGRNLYRITYRNRDPRLARDVVAALLNIFMARVTQTNRANITNAQKFLDGQIATVGAQLRAMEQRRAQFRRRYLDILPLESDGGVSHLDSARRTVTGIEAQLSDALAKQKALQHELKITPRTSGALGAAGGSSIQTQLAQAKVKLAELRTRFTEDDPDVIAQRRLVRTLKAEAAHAPRATSKANSDALGNPVYQQVQLSLFQNEATISALRSQLDRAHKDFARMQKLALAAPQVAAEYRNLERGYGVMLKNYNELLARRQTSRITEAADTQADRVQLRVVDPPQVPRIPVEPPRLLLISAVLLAGLGAGVALAIALGQMDRSIWDLGPLREMGQPVLGGISIRPSAEERRTLYPAAAGVMIAVLSLIAVYGGLLRAVVTANKVFL